MALGSIETFVKWRAFIVEGSVPFPICAVRLPDPTPLSLETSPPGYDR